MSPSELIQIMIKGYHPADQQLSKLLSGGGILSMVRICAIVCISSSYAGIFKGTGLLDGLKHHLDSLVHRRCRSADLHRSTSDSPSGGLLLIPAANLELYNRGSFNISVPGTTNVPFSMIGSFLPSAATP